MGSRGLWLRGERCRPKQVSHKCWEIAEHRIPQDQHFVEGTGPAKGVCVLGTLLKAPGYGAGGTLATGRGGDLTYSADNFKKAILLCIPLLNSSTLN